MSDIYAQALQLHEAHQGKIETTVRIPVQNKDDLSLAYSPGVAEPCRRIAADPQLSFDLTWRGRTVAVISDGSAVLGLGNIGPEAALPVMEGKSLLLKSFAGIDSVPIVINTQEPSEIITFVKQIAPSFGGINLEDISAPRCFEVEEALQDLGIPVFHDDQHGTAIVVAAALRNAAKVVGKRYQDLRVVIVGAGEAGLATAKMLLDLETTPDGQWQRISDDETAAVGDVIVVDSTGAIYERRESLPGRKQLLASWSNRDGKQGDLAEVIAGVDVVVGVSKAGLITPDMVRSMAQDAIVFALANPTPEIMPDRAKQAGAAVVATGRSDFPNQINNVLAFPAVFKAALDGRVPRITGAMKAAASAALAELVPEPTADKIIPSPFAEGLADTVAQRITQALEM